MLTDDIMRVFILYSNTAKTSPEFYLDDLPGSGGRMDIICRSAIAALWLSHRLRQDTRFIVVLNGPPKPPIAVLFDSMIMKKVAPDERSIASWIQKALMRVGVPTSSGIVAYRKSFQDIIKAYKDLPMYILHENGKPMNNIQRDSDAVFILGDHLGIPKKEEAFAARFAKEKISLGKKSYLASACISVINWWLDYERF